MNKLFSLMMAGSLGIASVPAAFAQSMSSESSSSSSFSWSSSSMTSSSSLSSSSSSSSDESSSARYYSRPSSASSYSSLSTRTRVRSLPSSSSVSSSSSRVRTRSSSSDAVAPGAFGGRSSVPGRGDDMRSRIPSQCNDLNGRALAQCVIRLSQRSSSSSSSSVSSASSTTGTGGTLTSDETLRQLFRMSVGEGTRIDVMRHLCGMVMGEFVSTCAQGESNLSEFNRHLNVWFMGLGRALSDFMLDLNRNGGDTTGDYFWNDEMPWMGSGSTMTGSGMVKGWQWMNDTTDDALLDDASEKDDTLLDGGMSADTHGQRAAWDACTDREGSGKARCIRQYIEQQNIQRTSGEAL